MRFRRATVAVDHGEQVAVVDGYLTDRVFLITRWSGDVDLSPRQAIMLGKELLVSGVLAACRSLKLR